MYSQQVRSPGDNLGLIVVVQSREQSAGLNPSPAGSDTDFSSMVSTLREIIGHQLLPAESWRVVWCGKITHLVSEVFWGYYVSKNLKPHGVGVRQTV